MKTWIADSWSAAAASLAGAVVLSWQGGPGGFLLGALAIAGACVAWGIDNNLTRKLSAADPVQIALIKGLVAGAVNLALALTSGAHLPSTGALGAAVLVGFLGYGVSLILFVLGLRHLGAARTGAYFSTAPFIGAALAVTIFHEDWMVRLVGADGGAAFTLLTTEPSSDVAPIHDRQMVILDRSNWSAWLEQSGEKGLLRALPTGSLEVEQVR
jgi:hypothetical protein